MAKITDIMLLHLAEQKALVIENKGTIKTYSGMIGEGFAKIDAYLKELGELPSDIPCVEYPDFEGMDDKNIPMVVSIYTAKSLPSKGDIRSITIPSRKAVVCLYKGSYEGQAKLYNEMMAWIKNNGYESTGASIEHYYTDPEILQEEQVTRVVMPIK